MNTDYTKIVSVSQIYSGEIKDPYCPGRYGEYFGEGEYTSRDRDGTSTFEYKKWRWMLLRCYNEKELLKEPKYRPYTVCDEWLNFQNFSKWISNNKYKCERLELDKDLFFNGSFEYSPSTCCLIPRDINYAISNISNINKHIELFNNYCNIMPKNILQKYKKYIEELNELS